MATPFDPHGAPLVRAVLLQGIRNAALILVAHHAIADGMSLVYLIRDTLRALSGSTLEPLPLLPSQDEILALDHVQVGTGADDRQQPSPTGAAGTYRPRDGARPLIQGLRLSANVTASLRDRARQEATSVHGALCAALVLAGRQVCDWRDIPVRLLSPINIRPTLGVGEDCGVILGFATSVSSGGHDFWNLARQAKNSIAPGRSRLGIDALTVTLQQVVAGGPDVAAASEFAAIAFAREGMLTNLGPVPFASQFGPVDLKALWGPAILSGLVGEQTIGVSTVGGSLYLTHTSHTPPAGLLTAMHSILVETCST